MHPTFQNSADEIKAARQAEEIIEVCKTLLGIQLPGDWSLSSPQAPSVLLAGLKTAYKAKNKVDDSQAERDRKRRQRETASDFQVHDPGYAAMSLDAAPSQIEEAIVGYLDLLGVALPAAWSFGMLAAGEILLTGLKTAMYAKEAIERRAEEEDEDDSVLQVKAMGLARGSIRPALSTAMSLARSDDPKERAVGEHLKRNPQLTQDLRPLTKSETDYVEKLAGLRR